MATASERETFERYVMRGSDALKAGKLDEATAQLKAALAIEPSSARVLALLGLTHFRAGHLDMARPIYEDLVERLPTDASHRLNLGLVYLKLGDADRAITSLEASRALDPSQGRAISYLGLAYARAGRYAEAYRSFLLAGQNELASEIEQNLTPAERTGITAQLGRMPAPTGEPVIARTVTPRTKPPSAPPGAKQEVPKPAPAPEAAPRPIPDIASRPAIVIDKPAPDDAPPLRMTESMQFVLGRGEVKPVMPVADARVDISQAVAAAKPAPAPLPTSGSIPLSQLATTELIHIDDGEDVFALGAGGALLVRVTERVITRLDGVFVTGGELAFEPTTRRSRGHQTDEKIDYGGTAMVTASGTGYLLALPGDRTFVPITLDDDILYLREDLVFAFEATLRWETGHVPGLRGQLPIVQFRGDGAIALRLSKPLVRVKLPPQGVVFVDATRLGGWIGRVIPRAVVPAAGGPLGELGVECTGEGIVLVEPAGAPTRPALAPHDAAPTPAPEPPPPDDAAKPADAEHELSAADLLSDLDDPQRDQI